MILGTEEEGAETLEEHAFYKKMMKKSANRLRTMKNKYAGEDCFLIGTGPSLLKTDFSLIRNKNLFGVNRLYVGFEKFDIQPQFYGISDGAWFECYGDDVLSLDTQLFLTRFSEIQYLRNYEYYHTLVKKEPILLRSLLPEMIPPDDKRPFEEGSNKFSKDATEGIYSGWTVIIDTGLQVCYYLGFNRVILLGCDCDYTYQRQFSDDPITKRLEPIPDNYECGCGSKFKTLMELQEHVKSCDSIREIRWMQRVFHCYGICKEAYEEDDREIINATVGGFLEVFPRKRLEDIV